MVTRWRRLVDATDKVLAQGDRNKATGYTFPDPAPGLYAFQIQRYDNEPLSSIVYFEYSDLQEVSGSENTNNNLGGAVAVPYAELSNNAWQIKVARLYRSSSRELLFRETSGATVAYPCQIPLMESRQLPRRWATIAS